jgi:hypothetical protein
MKKLVALLAAVGAVVFFWRKKQHKEDSAAWSSGSGTGSSWGDSDTSTTPDSTGEAATGGSDASETS